MPPQGPANALARRGGLGPRAWRRWLKIEIAIIKLPVITAWRLRNALAIKRFKAIGIFRVIRAISVARMGLASKHNDANGGKQSRNHEVLNEKTRFLHETRLGGEYGVRLSQSS
jgi:hypothetical protein